MTNGMKLGTVQYWRKGEDVQNFGDYIAEFLATELFYPLRGNADGVFLVGSVIDDIFVPRLPDDRTPRPPIVFWGCGVREVGGLSEDRRGGIRVLSARGPMSASVLNLGKRIPLGDPGFLLPALYRPKSLPEYIGKSICIPHFNDARTDEDLLKISGCDVIVRTNIRNSKDDFLEIIDKIFSSEFVLSASLHGAVVAAAYHKQFSFWDSGEIDIPFKWNDLSSSLDIACKFSSDIESGKLLYRDFIQQKVKLPDIWSLFENPPFLVRPSGLLKAFLYEVSDRLDVTTRKALSERVSKIERASGQYDAIFFELSDIIEEQKHESRRLNSELDRQKEEFQIERRRLQLANSKIEQTTTAYVRSQEALASLKGEVQASLSEIGRLKAELSVAEKQHSSAMAERTGLLARIYEIEEAYEDNAIYAARVKIACERLQRDAYWQTIRSNISRLHYWWAVNRLRLAGRNRRLRSLIQRSGLFDGKWYRRYYADLRGIDIDPLWDFIAFGASEGRNPNWLFDTNWYLSRLPDAVERRLNPLAHYSRLGARQGIDPSPYFDTAWYLSQNPDVRDSGMNPLLHYIRHGSAEGRSPHPLFNAAWYLEQNPDVRESGTPALLHFIEFGAFERRDPNPHFSVGWYLDTYRDVRDSGMNPLLHYILHGGRERREPNPRFSTPAYLAAHPDAAECPQGVLYDYLVRGEINPTTAEYPRATPSFARNGRRVLMIDGTYPTPDRDSGSVDAVNFISIFQQIGYEVCFISTSEYGVQAESDARRNLVSMGVTVFDKRYSDDIESFIRGNGKEFELIFLSRVFAGGAYYEAARMYAPESRIIFNTVDLHFRRDMRAAQLQGDRRAAYLAYGTAERELYLCRQADAAVVVSAVEALEIEQQAPGSRVFEIPLIREVPGRRNGFPLRNGIGFIGGYNHKPNVDAALFFLEEIWPKVWQAKPEMTFYLMGADMPPELRGRSDPGLVILGHVADLAARMEALRLTVAPLRYGAGAKGKVVSSLSHGVPCVVTPIAAEGMMLEHGEAVLIAEDPDSFAANILRLYDDEDLWTSMSDRGFNLMRSRHSIAAGVTHVKGMLRAILGDRY